jgi:hypothetical protein
LAGCIVMTSTQLINVALEATLLLTVRNNKGNGS